MSTTAEPLELSEALTKLLHSIHFDLEILESTSRELESSDKSDLMPALRSIEEKVKKTQLIVTYMNFERRSKQNEAEK